MVPSLAPCTYAAISFLGFHQLVHNSLYRKPVWVQKIKDPNPLPFTAASWKDGWRAGARCLEGRFSLDKYLAVSPHAIEKVSPPYSNRRYCEPRRFWLVIVYIVDVFLGLFIEIRDIENVMRWLRH